MINLLARLLIAARNETCNINIISSSLAFKIRFCLSVWTGLSCVSKLHAALFINRLGSVTVSLSARRCDTTWRNLFYFFILFFFTKREWVVRPCWCLRVSSIVWKRSQLLLLIWFYHAHPSPFQGQLISKLVNLISCLGCLLVSDTR